ncbi:MAG: hypothetical protein HY814_07455, partial [Candidatus Riflebacteria bacterium]|nr:hypothetical protein [Candidatus Riflebacteria bacterium]
MKGSELTTYTFAVTVPLTATSGTYTVGVASRVRAYDQNSLATLVVTEATVQPTLTLQRRAALLVTAMTFGRQPQMTLTQGQLSTVSFSVTNTGQAVARLTGAQLLQDRPLLNSAVLPLAEYLRGGTSRTFLFNVSASTVQTGVVKVNGSAAGADSNSSLSVPLTHAATLTLTVQKAASLVLEALRPARTSVSLGQTIPVTVSLKNTGEATMTMTVSNASIVCLPSSKVNLATVPGPAFKLGGGKGSGGNVVVNLTATGQGPVQLTSAVVQAIEDNTGRSLPLLNGMSPVTVTIQDPAGVQILSARAPRYVSQGQSFGVTVTMKNTGEASLRLTTVGIRFDDMQTLTPRLTGALPAPIPSYSTAPVRFTVQVPRNVLGNAHLRVDASGVDNNTGTPDLDALPLFPAATVTVQTTPGLQVDQVRLPPNRTCSQGRTFPLTVVLENNGQATAVIRSVTLTWSRPGLTTSAAAGNVTTVGGGLTRTYRMNTLVSASAATGPTTCYVAVDAYDLNSGQSLPLTTYSELNPMVVQTPAQLSIEGWGGPAAVSREQTFEVTVGVRDVGGAMAHVRSAVLQWSSGPVTAVLTSPVLPKDLSPTAPAATVLRFSCRADSNAALGLTTADVTVTANDLNDPTLDITLVKRNVGTTRIQTKGELRLDSLSTPTTMTQGQSKVVDLVVTNTGEAHVKNVLLPSLIADGAAFTWSRVATNPTSVPGLLSRTFKFNFAVNGGATAGPYA